MSHVKKSFVGYIGTNIDLERFPGHHRLPRHQCCQWAYVDVLLAVGEFSS